MILNQIERKLDMRIIIDTRGSLKIVLMGFNVLGKFHTYLAAWNFVAEELGLEL